eukprot:266134-Amorphochlora_amoeboformis.AAC.1
MPASVANHPYQKLVKGGTLRDYQLQGVEWLAALYQNGLNGILADEMGSSEPKFEERAAIRKKHFRKQKDKTFPVVVTSFELTIIDKSFLSHYTWVELIVDEGHRLKNMDCKLIKVLKQYNSQNRLLLTGTPLQNNLRELWSLLNFLLPTIFDNVGSFENWFNFTIDDKDGRDELVKYSIFSTWGDVGDMRIVARKYVGYGEMSEKNNQVLTKLHEILRPFVLRRLKINVLDKLPEKKEIVVYPAMTEFQRVLYKSIVEKKADK